MIRFRWHVVLPIAIVALVVAACSTAASPSPSGEATVATPSPSAPGDGAAPGESSAAGTPAASVDTSVEDPWRANATLHRGMDGEQFEYECPAGGQPDTVWGTDFYTDDSSVCTAAVHVGLITLEEGGTVTIEIRPGEDAYEASERNGIETSPYPAWGGSFVIVDD